ncbi:MAG: DUF1275 domain-containing protein [Coriobacteriaceae bacterium]|nr:DUF1275 domain-containing protein [Coriobacteriaceae bacterium]
MERAKQTSESIELGILLALAGGFMDVYSYMARGGVFANAQTGNILLVGVHLSDGDPASSLRYLFPVISFAVGIILTDLIRGRFDNLLHWRQVTVLLEALILAGVAFLPGSEDLLANCLTSFACGMQVESFRKIHGRGIATTMCIGNLRSALQSVDDYLLTRRRSALKSGVLYLGVILVFVTGAVLGNWCVSRFGLRAIMGAAVLLALAFLVMFIDREQDRKQGCG